MRPALCAREMAARTPIVRCRFAPFNEARALCAGNGVRNPFVEIVTDIFNEARALCAGNGIQWIKLPRNATCASMRPALCAREMGVLPVAPEYSQSALQ